MLIDKLGLFSDDQAITATAASTDHINLSAARNIGLGTPIPIVIQVTEAFNNLTSLKVAVEQDDNTSFSSATELVSETVLLAALVVGKKITIHVMPRNTEQFIRLYYTVTGTNPSTGKIHAKIATEDQTNGANV